MSGFDYDRARARADDLAGFGWTPERVRLLIDEHERETAFSDIGRMLRVSKNACIGKARRIGLPVRDRVVAGKNAEKAARRPRSVRASKPTSPQTPPKPAVETLYDARHHRRQAVREALALTPLHTGRISDLSATQCKWPVGDPKAPDFGFCGRLKAGDGPYCASHHTAAVDRSATANAFRGGLDRLANPVLRPRRPSRLTGSW